MKVTPLAGPNQGAVSSPSPGAATPDRKEAAKQAFLGNTGHSVQASDNPVSEHQQAAERNVRKIRMNTNASPNRFEGQEMNTESAISEAIEETTPESEVTRPISPQFAELAKQRRALQVKEREILAKEQAFAEKSQGAPGVDLAKVKANPLAVLREAGVTYEELTEAVLSDSSHNPEMDALKAKIDALEKGLESKFTERDSQAETQVLNELRKEAAQLVSQGDDFEMIRAQGKTDDITQLIHRIWKDSGDVLDVHEAATLIENELIDEALKVARLGKVQSRLMPAQATPAQPQRNQLRTLTNRNTASVPTSAKARAIAAFNGTLKK